VSAMLVTGVLMIAGLTSFFVGGAASDNLDNAQQWTELLRTVKLMAPQYKMNKSAGSSMTTHQGKPKPLRTLVDNVVEKIDGIEPDTKELNDKTYPSGWLEHSVEVSFRSIDLEGIVAFLKQVENNKRSFMIAITKLDIKKDRRDESKYRVSLTIATYEKSKIILNRKGKKRARREAK